MKKIVINSCYGGVGLSEKTLERYAELKYNQKLYKSKDEYLPVFSLVDISNMNSDEVYNNDI